MLLSLFVWAKIYKERFSLGWTFFLVLFSFCSSYRLVYYAVELKQYSMDVLAVGIFCLYLNYQQRFEYKKPVIDFIIITILLPFLIFLSYSTLFVFWIVIYNFLFIVRKNKNMLTLCIIYTLLSIVFFVFLFIFDLRYGLSERCLFQYWNDYFLCTNSPYCFIKSFGEGLRRLVVWFFGNNSFFRKMGSFFIPFFILSLLVSATRSFKERKFKIYGIDTLGLVIFIELFVLGIMKKYPFTGERVTLFFAPVVFLMIINGINLFEKNKPLYWAFKIIYFTFLIACSLNSLFNYLKPYL